MRAIAVVTVLLLAWQRVGATSVNEGTLKCAFLYNFTKFVEWPAERFASAADPIVIGLLANEPLKAEIAATVANRLVNGRPLVVREVTSVAEMEATHLIYVSTQEQERYAKIRGRAALPAVLVVGDDTACRIYGGGICFTQQGEKLRFAINIETVERSQLKISSQLQKLAVAVNRGP